MAELEPTELEWVQRTCRIVQQWRSPGTTILQLFQDANPDLSDRQLFLAQVANYLESHADLIDAWQGYSWDKRSTPSSYLDGLEVGFYSDGRQDVKLHEDAPSACADFLFRECISVLGHIS